APGTARLAGRALRRRRLAPEAAAPNDRALQCLSDVGVGAGRGGPRRPEERAARPLAATAAGGRSGARLDAGGEWGVESRTARAEHVSDAGAGGARRAVAARRGLGQVGRATA